MSARAQLAAGLLLTDYPWPDRATTDELRRRLHPTSVWQSGYLPAELRGYVAYGKELVRWSPRDDVTAEPATFTGTVPTSSRARSTHRERQSRRRCSGNGSTT